MSAIVWARPGLDLAAPEDRIARPRPKGRSAIAAARAVEYLKAPRLERGPRPVAEAPAPEPPPAFLHSTPGGAPLEMPTQDLARKPEAVDGTTERLFWRRALLLLGSALFAAVAGLVSFQVLRAHGLSALEGLTLVLSMILFGWIGFGFVTATAGFFLAWRERPVETAAAHADEIAKDLVGRTAVLMPIYNEDPGRVMSAVQAMGEDLLRLDAGSMYDFYILSDTRDEAIARAEATGFLRLRLRLGSKLGVYYRRRPLNIDRKAGNLAEWTRRFGGGYDYMLVLDADSLMSAETMVGLSGAMDRDARLGLLQTSPTIVNAETPFARLQQFACRLYGPIFTLGQAWWSGGEGNYWGHNAIIRVAAFAQSAGLPHLTGPRPFGGHILSHDFVEAALMRRSGWAVRATTALEGSYEETPPTLLDMAARDRRWCQGNLQHIRVLTAAGLHWVSRMHLARGVLSYLTPALWLMLLVCGVLVWPAQDLRGPERREVAALFALSLSLLMAPKLMGLALALRRGTTRAGFGGGARLVAGVLAETALWALATPVLMVMQCVAVVEVLLGRDSGWAAQRREGSELSPREAWKAHRGHIALGVAAALAAFLTDRYVLMWTSPVFLGLSLSSFLSLHTSRVPAGGRPGRRRMFQIPEEHRPTPVLRRAAELRSRHDEQAEHRRQIELLLRAPVPVYGAPKARVFISAVEPELQAA